MSGRRRLRPRWLGAVRARATLAAALLLACVYIASAGTFLVILRASLMESLDHTVEELAQDVAAEVEQDALPERLLPEGLTDTFLQVVHSDGRIVAGSSIVEGLARVADFAPAPDGARIKTLSSLPFGDGEDFRVAAMQATGPIGTVVVYSGTTLERVDHEVVVAGSLLAVGLPLLVGLVGATTWVLLGRALRPVEAIRSEVADISVRDLHRRVPEPPSDDEVGRLARTMNAMLDRLESATERQQRFVADASHELKSPLASLRAELELATGEPGSWGETARRLLVDVDRQERLVTNLLFLAARDEGAPTAPGVLFDLDDVVFAEAARTPPRPRVTVDISGVGAAPIRGRPDDMGRVVRNLLDNALRHAQSRVTLSLGVENGWAVLVVADDGPGIPAGERSRIFERFARVDPARSRQEGGTGLGLAISREIMAAHGGSIEVTEAPAGARLVVRIPAESA